jgi:ABC-type branched-subunit amino acid transport system substrate-binding protein
MKVAIDEINAAGGLLGKKIELKVYDGQSNIKNTRAMRSRPHWKTKWSCSRAR